MLSLGPKPVLYLTHSLIDTEMAQELVADLIANKTMQVIVTILLDPDFYLSINNEQTVQVDVQTIEDFLSSVLLSLLKTEEWVYWLHAPNTSNTINIH